MELDDATAAMLDLQTTQQMCDEASFGVLQIDQVYFPHIEVVGDIANAVWRMSESLEGCNLQWDLECVFLLLRSASMHSSSFPRILGFLAGDAFL